MPAHLDVAHVAREHAKHRARLVYDDGVRLAADERGGLFHFKFKVVVDDGFQDVIKSPHLVAAHGELRHVRHKDDHDLGVHLAKFLRCRHAVQQRKLYVHEHEVVYGFIIGQKRDGIAVHRRFKLKLAFRFF